MFGDSVSDQVVVLLFQHAMEFLWFWGWVLSDVEDVRQFGGAELGLKKRNQLVSLAWIAVERVGLKVKLVKNWLLHLWFQVLSRSSKISVGKLVKEKKFTLSKSFTQVDKREKQ